MVDASLHLGGRRDADPQVGHRLPSCHLMGNSYDNPKGSHDSPLLQGQKENLG